MDCLVTTLKASVADDSLRRMGEIRVTTLATAPATSDGTLIGVNTRTSVTLTILNDGFFYKDSSLQGSLGKEVKGTASAYAYAKPGSVISIVPKYDITILNINNCEFNIKELALMSYLEQYIGSGASVSGDVNSIKDATSLKVFRCNNAPNVGGDIASFSQCVNMTELSILASGVTGDIASLGNLTKLNNFGIANTQVHGSIEEFVSKQIAAGRTAATLPIPYARTLSKVTFEGVALSDNAKVPSGYNSKLSWDANGVITWSA